MTIPELLALNPTLLLTLAVILGLLVGSFLNVVVHRLPLILQRDWTLQCCEFLDIEAPSDKTEMLAQTKNLSLANPPSHCPKCQHRIKPWENIPLLSYLALGGKCSQCKSSISLRYPVVELTSGLLTGLIALQFGATLLTLTLFILAWALLTLTLIDFDHQLLPDDITLPLIWLGLLVNAHRLGMGVTLEDAVIGAVAGYLVLWLFYWAFKLLTGKEGMGFGDFKLLSALGAWLGWQSLLPIIILSSLVGAVVGIAMIALAGRDRSAPMPFGPFLAGAGLIMLLWGQQINAIYYGSLVG